MAKEAPFSKAKPAYWLPSKLGPFNAKNRLSLVVFLDGHGRRRVERRQSRPDPGAAVVSFGDGTISLGAAVDNMVYT